MSENKTEKKALFFQRFTAFMVDMIIVYLLVSVISMPFVDSKKTEELSEKAVVIIDQYKNREISTESYVLQYADLNYKIAKNNGLVTVITLLLYVGYFVVYQLYKGGQTIGKKLMKIKIVSTSGKLNTNQMIFRTFIANSLLVELITFILLLFFTKDIYFYGTIFFQAIQYIITIISVIMVISRKDGCSVHDLLVHTKVVQV